LDAPGGAVQASSGPIHGTPDASSAAPVHIGRYMRRAPVTRRTGPKAGPLRLGTSNDQGIIVIRANGPGATGELDSKYVTSTARSISPPTGSVQSGKARKLSPPVARKLFIATR